MDEHWSFFILCVGSLKLGGLLGILSCRWTLQKKLFPLCDHIHILYELFFSKVLNCDNIAGLGLYTMLTVQPKASYSLKIDLCTVGFSGKYVAWPESSVSNFWLISWSTWCRLLYVGYMRSRWYAVCYKFARMKLLLQNFEPVWVLGVGLPCVILCILQAWGFWSKFSVNQTIMLWNSTMT